MILQTKESLRYDLTTGNGRIFKGASSDTSDNYATDISSAVTFLGLIKADNIGLIGHSEGGMIAPMVANKKNIKL
jgi:pimeloyl-ACP methyl ester carboxylesterase